MGIPEKGASFPSREGRGLDPFDRSAEIESFDLRDTLRAMGEDEELEPPAGINAGVASSERSDSSNDLDWPLLLEMERLGGESFLGDCSLLSFETLEGACSAGDRILSPGPSPPLPPKRSPPLEETCLKPRFLSEPSPAFELSRWPLAVGTRALGRLTGLVVVGLLIAGKDSGEGTWVGRCVLAGPRDGE